MDTLNHENEKDGIISRRDYKKKEGKVVENRPDPDEWIPFQEVVKMCKKEGIAFSRLQKATGYTLEGWEPPISEHWDFIYWGKFKYLPMSCINHFDELRSLPGRGRPGLPKEKLQKWSKVNPDLPMPEDQSLIDYVKEYFSTAENEDDLEQLMLSLLNNNTLRAKYTLDEIVAVVQSL